MGFLPKDYVGVHTRVENFHKDHDTDISIDTKFELQGDVAIFKAVVKTFKGTFSGSSFGKLGKEKAFEKLETVAVGRALAFAGYEIKGGIASNEEMQEFDKKIKVVPGKHSGDNWFNEKDIDIIKDMLGDATLQIDSVAEYLNTTYSISKDMAKRLNDFIEKYKSNLG